MYPLLPDPPQARQRKHLKAAAVGEDGAVPAGEFMQPAHAVDEVISGAHMQMVGVAQHHLTVQLLQIEGGHAALDGAAGGNIHKRRGLHGAVGGFKYAPAGGALGLYNSHHEMQKLLISVGVLGGDAQKLLQAQPAVVYFLCQLLAQIADVPRLVYIAGDGLLILGIADDEAVFPAVFR